MHIPSSFSADSPTSCEDASCEDNEECIELKNEAVSGLAICLRSRNNTNQMPPPPPPPPRPAMSCDQLDCGRGFECLHSRRNGRNHARCRRRAREPGVCDARRRPFEDQEEENEETPDENEDTTIPRVSDEDSELATDSPMRPTGRPPRVGPGVLLNLPDECSKRICCEDEQCVVQSMFDGAPIALCMPVSYIYKISKSLFPFHSFPPLGIFF